MRIIYCHLCFHLPFWKRKDKSLGYTEYVATTISKYCYLIWDLNQHKNYQSCSVETHFKSSQINS